MNAAHPLPAGCNIQIRGVAPGASLIGLKVFGNSNSAPTSRFIEAIDYAVTDGADVLNESFGGNPYPDTGTDPISLADAAAIAAGVTVVASTGDAGVTGTIGSPASNAIGIIGVGATTTFRSYQQSTYAGTQLSNGTWVNNNISGLSSGGISQAGRTPDLVAPGDLGWALCTPDLNLYAECTDNNGNPSPIQDFGGTSQSSPLTAGAAALVIEAYEQHPPRREPEPGRRQADPDQHRHRPRPPGLRAGCRPPEHAQGRPGRGELAGRQRSPDADRILRSSSSKNQLFAAAYPNSPVAQSLTVTNVGDKPQKVDRVDPNARATPCPTRRARGDRHGDRAGLHRRLRDLPELSPRSTSRWRRTSIGSRCGLRRRRRRSPGGSS